MDTLAPAAVTARLPVAVPAEPPLFSVPARHNPRLQALVDRLNADEELRQLWRCAHLNAAERLGQGDCGEVHVRIVANAALKLLRLLRDAGQPPAIVTQHRLPAGEAEVVVVLAAALHALGLAVQAEPYSAAGLALATVKGRELLAELYGVRERTTVLAETLHAVAALDPSARCLTLEAGLLRLADALDLSTGRARGLADGPQVAEVTIQKFAAPPVRVVINLTQPDGAPALADLLAARLRGCRLEALVAVQAHVSGVGLPLWPPAR